MQLGAVFVDKLDGVLVDGRGIGSGVSRVAGDCSDLSIPTRKGVGVLRGRRLGRGLAVIGRGRTVRNVLVLFELGTVFIQPGNGVLVDFCGKGRGVGLIAGHRFDRGRPFIKGVGELRVSRLGRRLSGVGGRLAVGNLGALQLGTVFVDKLDRVLVDGGGECRGVGRVAGHDINCGSPLIKGVGVLSGCRLGRGLAVIGRGRAIGNVLVLLQLCAVLVQPCDGVGVGGIGELRGIGDVTGDRGEFGTPLVEGVGILRGRRLGGRCAVIVRVRAVGDVLVLF